MSLGSFVPTRIVVENSCPSPNSELILTADTKQSKKLKKKLYIPRYLKSLKPAIWILLKSALIDQSRESISNKKSRLIQWVPNLFRNSQISHFRALNHNQDLPIRSQPRRDLPQPCKERSLTNTNKTFFKKFCGIAKIPNLWTNALKPQRHPLDSTRLV